MKSITLNLVAVKDGSAQPHIEPVSSVDDAKLKLDALNASCDHCFKGHIEMNDGTGTSEVWVDPEFNLSDLDEYFEKIEENGGYETHAEFAEDNGMFHDKMDELFSGLKE